MTPPRPSPIPPLSQADRQRFSLASLRTCRRIADKWGLEPVQVEQLLGVGNDVDDQVFTATDEQLERLSLVLGIWKELATVFGPDDPRGHAYVRTEPELTTGGTVLEVMLSGIEGLWGIRRRLAQMTDEWLLMNGGPCS